MDRKELLSQLNEEFNKKHNLAIQKAENTLALVLENKEFANNYNTQKNLEFEIAKAKFEKKDFSELNNKLQLMKKELDIILKNNNISKLSLSPQFQCKKCNDTGYYNGEQCTCFKKRLNEFLVKASGLEPTVLTTFKDYNPNIATDKKHKESLDKLKVLLLKYCDKFPYSNYCTIILSGHTGVGKTFALECLASEILKRGFSANFITAFQLNNQFLKYHTCFDANKQSYMDMLLLPDLLIIDDLGTEPILRNVSKEYLLLIIQERMLKHKATYISTNLSPEDIFNRYGERIFSRLTHKTKSLFLKLEGSDLRQIK